MISQTLEYALRAVVYLADQSPEACTNERIAEVTKVPPAYLSKVLQGLRRKGIVLSQRGAGGGMSLAKAPCELTILEVVEAFDPIQRIESCPLGLASHRKQLCPLHKRLDDVMALAQEAFGQTTIADLLEEPTTSKPLCEFPKSNDKPRKKKSRPSRK